MFLREVNSHPLVRQQMLESFQDNIKSFHLQNFVENCISYQEDKWTPLGCIKDPRLDGTLYSGYLKHSIDEGVNKSDILNYVAFCQ